MITEVKNEKGIRTVSDPVPLSWFTINDIKNQINDIINGKKPVHFEITSYWYRAHFYYDSTSKIVESNIHSFYSEDMLNNKNRNERQLFSVKQKKSCKKFINFINTFMSECINSDQNVNEETKRYYKSWFDTIKHDHEWWLRRNE